MRNETKRELETLYCGREVPTAVAEAVERAEGNFTAMGGGVLPTAVIAAVAALVDSAAESAHVDYRRYTVAQLAKLCEDRGMSSDGKKADLIARLEANG